jgi:RNA polymerase sigma-70 factor, ECF subfamily
VRGLGASSTIVCVQERAPRDRLAPARAFWEHRAVSLGEPSDEVLLYAVARGDREALAQLYERHVGVMLALAERILRQGREAEDLVHDVFVEAWRHAGDYDPARASVRTWLLLRLRSRAFDRMRSVGAKKVSSLAELDDREGAEHELHRDDHPRVREALSKLTDEQRTVLELGYFHGLSSQEIADCLQIPIGTVKSRVSAALSQLRRSLGAHVPRQATS